MFIEALVSFFLVLGGVFALGGAVGLVRLPDFFSRLHAPTKATTLGVGGMLIASMIHFAGEGSLGVHELLVTLFLFVSAPVSANVLAKAAHHRRVGSGAAVVPEDAPR